MTPLNKNVLFDQIELKPKLPPSLKICGFKTWENIVGGILEGVDYFGFVLVPTSKRFFGDNLNELEKCCNIVVKSGKKAIFHFLKIFHEQIEIFWKWYQKLNIKCYL